MKDKIEVKIPASVANLGPGFDTFGLALPLYLTIRANISNNIFINNIGESVNSLPTDETNLIFKTIDFLYKLEGLKPPNLYMEVESEIPLERGLGSSGAAIIGGLLVGNYFLNNKYTREELFNIAVEIEGHPDNVGASLYGGLIISTFHENKPIIEKIPFPKNLKIILAIPEYLLSTREARGKIPANIPIKDVAYNIGHSSLFITYILTEQIDKLTIAMNDRVHQPYREKSVKGLEKLIDRANKTMEFTAALSGAGPSIILLTKEINAEKVKKIIEEVAKEENINFDTKEVSISNIGAKIFFN